MPVQLWNDASFLVSIKSWPFPLLFTHVKVHWVYKELNLKRTSNATKYNVRLLFGRFNGLDQACH